MMRRMICFLLVLCMAMAMTVPALAATNSPANKAPVVNGNPSTGDIILKWGIVMLLALLALCVMVVLYRKMFR